MTRKQIRHKKAVCQRAEVILVNIVRYAEVIEWLEESPAGEYVRYDDVRQLLEQMIDRGEISL